MATTVSSSPGESVDGSIAKTVSRSSGSAAPSLANSVKSEWDAARVTPSLSNRRKTLSSRFVKAKTSNFWAEGDEARSCRGRFKKAAVAYTRSKVAANLFAVIVLVDFLCTCLDVDARAAGEKTPDLVQITSDICLCAYSLETLLLLIVKGPKIFLDVMMMLDAFVLLCGYVETIMQYLGHGELLSTVAIFRMLRLVRILRVTRVLRRTGGFRELQKLIRMMSTCIRTLFWSFVFCFIVMTVWALLIVELLNPLMDIINQETGIFDDCPQCIKSTQSVMRANVLLFKTVIAGDGWGLIAVPFIEAYPLSAIIFCGSLLTLVFCVMNLIVAVVVDTFAEARERDVLNLAEEIENNVTVDRERLEKIFQRIDADGSGMVTFDELLEGARKDPEFQSRLRVMDIDEADLEQLFEMIDVNGEGEIAVAEFIAPLSRWVTDSKTAPRFIKYNMLRSLAQQEELYSLSRRCFETLVCRMEELVTFLHGENSASLLPSPDAQFVSSRTKDEATMELEFVVGTQELQPFSSSKDAGLAEADGEAIEQPHSSQKALLQPSPDEEEAIKNAIESLERHVLNATELALKGSVALVEQALRDRQRRHRRSPNRIASGTPNLQHLLEDNVFERRQEKKHSLQPVRDIETPEAFSPQRPRLPIGTFGKPGSPSSPQMPYYQRRNGSKEIVKSTDTSSWYRGSPAGSPNYVHIRTDERTQKRLSQSKRPQEHPQ